MNNGFQWILELVDKASRPAKQAADATGGFEKELKKLEEQIERVKKHPLEFKKLQGAKKELRELTGGSKSFAERFEEMGRSIRNVGFVQNLMLGAEALKIGFEVGEKVVGVIADIGSEMLHAAGGAERFKISFSELLGQEGGNDVLEYIEHITKATELTDDELKGMSAHLLTVGFNAKELGQILPASLDIASFLGGGVDKAQAAAEALAHIKTTGEISKRSLGSLGLEYGKVMDELQKETGLTVEQINKQLTTGKFGPQALHAVLQSIANKEGGALGTAAERMAGSVEAKWKKIKHLPEDIMEKWADTPGFKKFSTSLDKILGKLDPNGPNGKKLFAALDRASSKVVDLVGKFASGDGIDKFVAGVSKAADELDQLPAVLDKVVAVSEVLATIWGASKIVGGITTLTAAMPALGTATGTIAAVVTGAAAPFLAVGAAAAAWAVAIYRIINAVKELGGLKHVWQDFKDWAGGQKPAEATGNAPSKNYVWDDKINGYRYTGPAIPSQSQRVASAAGVGDQTAHVHVSINAPSGDADEISHTVKQALPGAMQQGFEKMAVASGAM